MPPASLFAAFGRPWWLRRPVRPPGKDLAQALAVKSSGSTPNSFISSPVHRPSGGGFEPVPSVRRDKRLSFLRVSQFTATEACRVEHPWKTER